MKKLIFLLMLAGSALSASPAVATPDAPTMTLVTDGTHASVTWHSVPGATGYILHYAPYPFQGVETIGSVDLQAQTFFSAQLWPNAAYYVAVQAYDSLGSSDYSNIEYFIMGPPNPQWIDNDGDGYHENEGDCNDGVKGINPGAADICGDGIDQDCDGVADEGCGTYPEFTENHNDGTLSQLGTNLVWMKGHYEDTFDGNPINWHSSVYYCKNLVLGIADNWRLPTREELLGIVDNRRSPVKIDPRFVAKNAYYWTSDEYFVRPGVSFEAYVVDFGTGMVGKKGKQTTSGIARCVHD